MAKARNIKDRIAVGDDIFTIEHLDGDKIKLIPSPINIVESGTDVNKGLLQPLEDSRVKFENDGLVGFILENQRASFYNSEDDLQVFKLNNSKITINHFADVVLSPEMIENFSPTGKIETGNGWIKIWCEDKPENTIVISTIKFIKEASR